MTRRTGNVICLRAGYLCGMTIDTNCARLFGDTVGWSWNVLAGAMTISAGAGNPCRNSPNHNRIGALMTGFA